MIFLPWQFTSAEEPVESNSTQQAAAFLQIVLQPFIMEGMTSKRSHSSRRRHLCTVQMHSVLSNLVRPSCCLQELELPEDMNLDDDGKAEEEEGGEDSAGADQHQNDQQQQQHQSGFQDQPDEKGSEPQDTDSPAIDQDTNMEDDTDE